MPAPRTRLFGRLRFVIARIHPSRTGKEGPSRTPGETSYSRNGCFYSGVDRFDPRFVLRGQSSHEPRQVPRQAL